jgi:steroid delta-isomerase-like uncharacterized protein
MNRRLILERAAEALAAWNRGDADGTVAHMVEDVIWRDVALGMPLNGRAALADGVRRYMTAFPDLHVEVTSSTLDGTRLVQEWTVTGTHGATGRWTQVYGATVTTFDDDAMMIEGSLYWNPLTVMRQLGLADQTGPTVATKISTTSAVVAPTARKARAAQSGGARTRKSSPAAT